MKLKFYLRGLGIGIVVTAVVMGASGTRATVQGEPEVKSEAVLADLAEENLEELENRETEEPSQEVASEAESTEPEESSQEKQSGGSDQEPEESSQEKQSGSSDQEPEGSISQAEEPDSAAAKQELVEIVISHGDGSGTVSKKLAQAGLVESAESYDRYLIQNGYDKKLSAGVHRIPKDAKDDEIAKMLCGKN